MRSSLSFIALFLVTASVFISGCVNDMEEVNALSAKNEARLETIHGIETYYYNVNGALQGIMTAPVIYRHMVGDTSYLEATDGLRVRFYQDSLKLQSILTAKKGVFYENSENITISDSVVVESEDGKTLETDLLKWDPKKQQFYTEEPVKLTTPNQVIYGQHGLVAPPDLSWYQFNTASGDIEMDSSFSGQ